MWALEDKEEKKKKMMLERVKEREQASHLRRLWRRRA